MAKLRTGTAQLGLYNGVFGVGGGSALTYAQTVLADSPVGYWKMDEASGNIADSSGNAQTMTVSGTPTYRATGPGTGNFGVTFVSASSQVFTRTDAGTSVFDTGDTFSLEVWYKRSAVQGVVQTFLCKGTNTWRFYIGTDNKLNLDKTNAAGSLVKSSGAITDTTTWHHCVVTKTGATRAMYLDGVDVSAVGVDATMVDGNGDMLIANGAAAGQFLDGSLSHVAVYNTALSAARVAAHYAAMV